LAAEGANVALVARPAAQSANAPGTLAGTAARLRAYGTSVITLEADLFEPDDRAEIVPTAARLLGGTIDVLVNNAATNMPHTLVDYALERRRRLFELNFHAPLDLTQAVLPGMLEKAQGWVVNVSSGSARHITGPPFGVEGLGKVQGAYGASKAALNRMSNALAAELYGSGIRVNTIEPRAAVRSDGAVARGVGMIPASLFEPMEAMVEATVELCRCEAARTGGSYVSLDLLEELDLDVWSLDSDHPVSLAYQSDI
jgi:NAD(P)-dependent dehydrogenase (short-subunit alcohol dehydrogenase family)